MAQFGYKYFYDHGLTPERLESPYGLNKDWDRPKGDRPGKYMTQGGDLQMCYNGLHAWHTFAQCKDDINGETNVRVFKVEAEGKTIDWPEKFCASKMRLLYEVSPKTGRRLTPGLHAAKKRRLRRLRDI